MNLSPLEPEEFRGKDAKMAQKNFEVSFYLKRLHAQVINWNQLNDTNTRIVMENRFKLCQSLEKNQVERFHECCELYFSIRPRLIGSFGSPWLNSDTLN